MTKEPNRTGKKIIMINFKKNSAATTKVLYPGLFMICPIDGDTSTTIVMVVETAPGYSFGSRKI